MTQNRPIKLRLPRQDADTFEHFTLDPVVALAWSNRLPQAQAQRASQQLREVLDNLNRIPLPAQQRFAILEALYASVQVALSSLASRYLNQPLALPEEPLQLAELAATLQDLTASGYTLAAVHTLREPSEITGISPARLVCESLLRAIDLTGQTMLLHYQLYQAVPDQSWRQLHQLYALAEDQGLENLPVALPGHAEASIGQCYTQTLILGCAKPNQLRQADLEKLFQALQCCSA